jgi:hypothetical protein
MESHPNSVGILLGLGNQLEAVTDSAINLQHSADF